MTTSDDAIGKEASASCPSCGRFVGPYPTCPYCGARLAGRISLRAVKIAAILLATVGLLALWWAARRVEVPLLTIEEAQGTMNMAYVRVRGTVNGTVSYDPVGQYLGFWVDDGTGEVRISAYRDVTEALLAEQRMPAQGDVVEVAGTLRIREDFVALTLNVPEHLTLERPTPVTVEAGALSALDAGARVRVAGQVRSIFSPYAGMTLITVRDATGEVPVAIDETFTTLWGPLPEITPGQGLEVVGVVTLYKDQPQLAPASPDDLMLAEAPPVTVEQRALGALLAADEGGRFQVQGRIVEVDAGFGHGFKGVLDDGTGQVILLLWQSVVDELPPNVKLVVGADVQATGELKVYRDELEIVPDAALYVRPATVAVVLPA